MTRGKSDDHFSPSARLERALAWPIRHPWAIVVASLCAVLLAVGLISTLPSDGSLSALLPTNDSSSAALAEIGEDYHGAEQVTLLLTATDQSTSDGAAETLAEFADRLIQSLEHSESANEHIADIRYTWPSDGEQWAREMLAVNLPLYLDEQQFEEFKQRLSTEGIKTQIRMNERAAAAPGVAGSSLGAMLDDPLRLRDFAQAAFADLGSHGTQAGEPMFSTDQRSLMIQITARPDASGAIHPPQLMDSIDALIASAKPSQLQVQATGGPAIAAAAERSIRSDMIRSSIGTCILLQLLFLATYRRLLMFPIALLPAAIGVMVGFGVFALLNRPLSPPTAVLGALLAGLGVDYAIHYLSHAQHDLNLVHTSRRLAPALAMACVTSSIAFSSIGLSDVAALRDFATIGAIGLAATLITSLTVLPALLNLTKRRKNDDSPTAAQVRWRADGIMGFAIARRKAGLAGSALFVLAAIALLGFHPHGPIQFDQDLAAMHPQPNAPLQTQQRLAQAFPGQADTLLLYVQAESEDELIQRAADVRSALENDVNASKHLASVFGIDRLIPLPDQRQARLASLESIDPLQVQERFDAAVAESPFKPQAFADYREYLAQVLRPNPSLSLADLNAYPQLTSGLLPIHHFQADAGSYSSVVLLSLNQPLNTTTDRAEAISAIRYGLADIPGVTLTGMPVIGHDIEKIVRRDLSLLLLLAAGAVVLWLAVCFRSVRDTLAALIPVMGGLVVLFAVMRLTGTGLNLINLIALPLLAGLGVDDGVFLVAIARDARRRGADRAGLVAKLSSSVQAIILTSMTTSLAFGSLIFTAVPAIRSLGIVMAIGIAACLLLSIFALAPLLFMLHRPSVQSPANHGVAA